MASVPVPAGTLAIVFSSDGSSLPCGECGSDPAVQISPQFATRPRRLGWCDDHRLDDAQQKFNEFVDGVVVESEFLPVDLGVLQDRPTTCDLIGCQHRATERVRAVVR